MFKRRSSSTGPFKVPMHRTKNGPESEKFLLKNGKVGAFLVRPSKQTPGDFTIVVKDKKIKGQENQIINVKLRHDSGIYDLYQGRTFPDIAKLLQYYMAHPDKLHEASKNETISLKTPMYDKTEIPKSGWIYLSMTGAESEKLVMEKGKVGTFLVRESASVAGEFVLVVRSEKKVSQIKIRRTAGKYDVGAGATFDMMLDLVEHYTRNKLQEPDKTILRLGMPLILNNMKKNPHYEDEDVYCAKGGLESIYDDLPGQHKPVTRAPSEGDLPPVPSGGGDATYDDLPGAHPTYGCLGAHETYGSTGAGAGAGAADDDDLGTYDEIDAVAPPLPPSDGDGTYEGTYEVQDYDTLESVQVGAQGLYNQTNPNRTYASTREDANI